MFTNIQEIKQYTNVSNRLDFELLKTYIEEALRVKVYPYIPKSVADTLTPPSGGGGLNALELCGGLCYSFPQGKLIQHGWQLLHR